MSHQEQATLEFATACRQMLEDAQSKLNRLFSNMGDIRRNSSKLVDGNIGQRIESIVAEASRTVGAIGERMSSLGATAYRQEIELTRTFLSGVNSILLQAQSISSAVDAAFEAKMEQKSDVREGLEEHIASIGDLELASVVRLLSKNRKHDSLSLEELTDLARSVIDPSVPVKRRLAGDVVTRIEEDMASEKISQEVIDKVVGTEDTVSPLKMMDKAVTEIFDERLRRSAVQAIVKSITARGFIVGKGDIRHMRDTDTVRILAKKPAGQTAEFLINLDGKFIYHFEGYEGRACEKDISPMEKSLEEIYGIKMTDRKTIWVNPDKLNSSHHQEMKVRRDS